MPEYLEKKETPIDQSHAIDGQQRTSATAFNSVRTRKVKSITERSQETHSDCTTQPLNRRPECRATVGEEQQSCVVHEVEPPHSAPDA